MNSSHGKNTDIISVLVETRTLVTVGEKKEAEL
jgi:hypothetical protein